jgi:hypothetical protein
MKTPEIEQFDLFSSFKWSMRFCAVASWPFVLLILYLPFSTERGADPRVVVGVTIVLLIFFGGIALYATKIAIDIPDYAISCDSVGIWKSRADRWSLVRWSEIKRLRERPVLQRLDLLDGSDRVLLKLEYQLFRFEKLRENVLERAKLEELNLAESNVFAKSPAFHAMIMLAFVIVLTLLTFAFLVSPFLAFVVFLFTVLIPRTEYLNILCKVEIQPDVVILGYPLKRVELKREEILDVHMRDYLYRGSRSPAIVLQFTRSTKPVVISNLVTDTTTLFRAIEAWKNAK